MMLLLTACCFVAAEVVVLVIIEYTKWPWYLSSIKCVQIFGFERKLEMVKMNAFLSFCILFKC